MRYKEQLNWKIFKTNSEIQGTKIIELKEICYQVNEDKPWNVLVTAIKLFTIDATEPQNMLYLFYRVAPSRNGYPIKTTSGNSFTPQVTSLKKLIAYINLGIRLNFREITRKLFFWIFSSFRSIIRKQIQNWNKNFPLVCRARQDESIDL